MGYDLTCAANLSLLFNEVPLAQRFEQAQAVGFGAAEVQFLTDAEVDTLGNIVSHSGIPLILLNADAGDLSAGEAGFAGVEGAEKRFEDSIDQALDRARRLDCASVHVLAGKRDESRSLAAQLTIAAERYSWAAAKAASVGVTIMLEPLSVPGYLVSNLTSAATLVRMTDSGIAIQYDYFHMAAAHEDATAAFIEHQQLVGHIQVANPVDRAESNSHDPAFIRFLESVNASDYAGHIGFEYSPKAGTVDGLHWAKSLGLL